MQGQCVAETRDRMTTAIAASSEGQARTRDQIKFASLIMAIGDPREAAAVGTQALDLAAPMRSGRVIHGLRDLRRLTQPHAHLTEVADLRDRIRTVVAA